MIKEGEAPKIKGSIMLAFAESKKDVLKALQEDIYFKQGVWNWNKVQIHPVCLDILRPHTPSVPLTITSSSVALGSLFRRPMFNVQYRFDTGAFTCGYFN